MGFWNNTEHVDRKIPGILLVLTAQEGVKGQLCPYPKHFQEPVLV